MRQRRSLAIAITAALGLVLGTLGANGGCGAPRYARGPAGTGAGGDVGSGGATDGTGGNPDGSGGAGAGPIASGGTGDGTGGAAGGSAGAASGGRSGTGGGVAGSNTGGAPGNGGAIASGGRGTGGAAGAAGAGGSGVGGESVASGGRGGTGSGGANTGGANTGGANTGGANTGGANTGGANTGGANTGGASTGGAPAPSGAILHYAFDETTGTSVADGSGNARNGTVAGGGTFAAGMVRNGLIFAGGSTTATQTYVAIPVGLLNGARTMTITLWVKVTEDRPWQRIFDFHKSSTTGYMFLTPHAQSTTVARFGITLTGYQAEQQLDVPMLPVGVWKHLALVFEATGASFYVDGVKAAANTGLTLRPADIGIFTNQWLGRSAFNNDPYFAGQLDELRIYDRALSASEIAALFALR